MLKNYLLIALRQMARHWSFSAINIAGLALSMSVCLLILTLLHSQGQVDAFHEKADRIVRMTTTIQEDFGTAHVATSSVALGPELARQSPDVEGLLQMRRAGGQLVRSDGLRAGFAGLYAQPSLFEMLDFDLQAGSESSSLEEPFQIVLSPEMARLLFADRDPVGEILEWQNIGSVTVAGVLGEPRGKSHLRPDVLISFSTMKSLVAAGSELDLTSWTSNTQFYNYLLLRDGARPSEVAGLANQLARAHETDTDSAAPVYWAQSLTDINLGADLSNQIGEVMSRQVALVLSLLAAILIATAIFNYVNLTVSRSVRRGREIGIRKVMGAQRKQLLYQLVTESTVTAVVALVLAMGILAWLLPQFNALSAFSSNDLMRVSGISAALMLQFLAFAVLLGIVAGLVPAMRMSRMSPAATLKGIGRPGRQRFGLRKALVVGQFAISMVAIVMTIVIYRQAGFMMRADLGFEEADLVQLELQGLNYGTVRAELLTVPGVSEVAATSEAPSGGSNTWTDIQTEGMSEPIYMQVYSVDERFLEQYRIPLIAGQNLVSPRDEAPSGSIILTESAAARLGFPTPQEAVGESVLFDTYSRKTMASVAGVVSDFYTNGLEDGPASAVLHMRPAVWRYASIRLDRNHATSTLAGIESVWQRLAPGSSMRYKFFDDQVREGLSSLVDGTRILGLFAFLIVVIAGLGLFGMASYSAETRVKEVGIRKVVGAEAHQLVTLLSRELLTLVAFAVILAVPIAVILTNQYLSLFAEHVAIGALTLISGIAPVVLLAVVTVGSQAFRAAITDPVEVLRAE